MQRLMVLCGLQTAAATDLSYGNNPDVSNVEPISVTLTGIIKQTLV